MEINYHPPFLLFNKHLETIYPSLLRKVKLPAFKRERITTPDNDFLDLDWLTASTQSSPANAGDPVDNVVVISHGLEGNSQRPYIKGMAKAFFENNYDVVAWNYRGCGEEMNKQLRFYHSGATDDLDVVVKHAASKYKSVFLIGFSLGGNLTLKYLGEKGTDTPVKGATVFSVPLNLHSSCLRISERENFIYANRFLKSLKKKVIAKSKVMKGIDVGGIDTIKTLISFDDRYTAPIHGFKDALNYYKECSSLYFLEDIRVPTLIVNAKNDPFLSADCYPAELKNRQVQLEYPAHGGHVGFSSFGGNGIYWSEWRALEFIKRVNFPT